MRQALVTYLATLACLLAADMVWLLGVAPGFYQAEIGPLLLEQPRLLPAALFYLGYGVGIVVFAVQPGVAAGRWQRSAALGALFGLLAYATYDLTNLATLRGWSLTMTVVDLVWGTLLTAGAATGGYAVARALRRRSSR